MRKSKIAASPLIFLVVFSSVSLAKDRQGAEVVITKKDGTLVSGELIAVKKNSLLILSSGPEAGTDLTLAFDEIQKVRIVRKSHVWDGLGYGLLIGGGGGAIAGFASGDDRSGFFMLTASDKAMILSAFFGSIGMIIGGIGGGLAGRDLSYSVGGKSDNWFQLRKGELAELARVKKIQ